MKVIKINIRSKLMEDERIKATKFKFSKIIKKNQKMVMERSNMFMLISTGRGQQYMKMLLKTVKFDTETTFSQQFNTQINFLLYFFSGLSCLSVATNDYFKRVSFSLITRPSPTPIDTVVKTRICWVMWCYLWDFIFIYGQIHGFVHHFASSSSSSRVVKILTKCCQMILWRD